MTLANEPADDMPRPPEVTGKYEDQAALTSADAQWMAAMGPESVMTEPCHDCGYPEMEAGS